MRLLAAATIVVAAVLCTASTAQAPPIPNLKRGSLKGIGTMLVLISGITDDAEKVGLDEGQLRTLAELALRRSGIEVPPIEDLMAGKPPRPQGVLKVDLIVLSTEQENPPAIFSCRVAFSQGVALRRDPSFSMGADTWDTESLYRGGVLRDRVREAVQDGVDKFLNDYLIVNPKK